MTLKELFNTVDLESDIIVSGLATDSRQVTAGNVFFAIPSLHTTETSIAHILEAIEKGCAAVVMNNDAYSAMAHHINLCIVLPVNDVRQQLARCCSVVYCQPQTIIAVTGTNGKTSVAHFIYQLWRLLGQKAAYLGTIGLECVDLDKTLQDGLTTPSTMALHKTLQQCADAEINYMALEASSHGLDQFRLDGVKIHAGVFTNLSHDHLDYHHNFQNYFEAKARLFKNLLTPNAYSIVHIGNDYAEQIVKIATKMGHNVITVGEKCGTIALEKAQINQSGYMLTVRYEQQIFHVQLPLYGDFQISNALLAAGALLSCGWDFATIMHALERLSPVKGRMQKITGTDVFVDYAHTPDALKTALSSLRAHTMGKLWVVFGCGGNRDTAKRPLMGAIATQYADHVIITDDNPREEAPELIRQQIMDGCDSALEIGDRQAAITWVMNNKADEDVVLIAGKGHENYQIIGGNKFYFDDVEVAQNAQKLKILH